jgi:hypothetical protein
MMLWERNFERILPANAKSLTMGKSDGPQYATKVAIPRHLIDTAKRTPQLISKVTIEAYNFIVERCNKDLKTSAVVAIGLSAIMQEYELGEHTAIEKFDFGKIAHDNDVALAKNGQTEIAVSLPDELYAVAEKNDEAITDLLLKFSPILKEACGGDKALAAVVATMLANVVYYEHGD